MSKLHQIFVEHYGNELLTPNSIQGVEQQIKELFNDHIYRAVDKFTYQYKLSLEQKAALLELLSTEQL